VTTDGARVQLWDMAERKELRQLPEEPSGTKWVLFAPDGKLLLGGNKVSRLWDVAKGRLDRISSLELEASIRSRFLRTANWCFVATPRVRWKFGT